MYFTMYFHSPFCRLVARGEDVGGTNGGPGWLLGNNKALLTDWKVSLHLALSEPVGYCQALLGNSISESPVALVTEQQLNSR